MSSQKTAQSPASSSGRSLRRRLPVSISALIAVVLAAMVWAAYREVEITLVRAGGDRAQNAAGQLASLFAGSVQQVTEELRRAAIDPVLHRFLRDPTEASHTAAVSRLRQRVSPTARRLEVWTDAGTRMLELDVPGASAATPSPILPPVTTPPSQAGMRDLQVADGIVYSESVIEIVTPPPASQRLGYLVARGTVSVNPPGILSQMVGPDAVIALGNKTGGVWTDLSSVVPAPPVDLTRSGIREFRTPDGTERLGAVAEIRATPFAVWVEFPRDLVVAPARTFLNRMLLIGGMVVLVGAGLVRAVTGRLTTPLIELTSAAEAIAAGDYTRRVTIDRGDEIGRLGIAFNAMGSQIEEGRQRLQAQIRERTQALDALRASEAHHRAIVTVAFDCIITIDANGTVMEFNPAAERTFGYRRADALGRELASLIVPPSLRDAHRAGLARLTSTGEPRLLGKLVEITAMRAHGAEFPVELAIRAIPSEGTPMYTGVVRDITQRKHAERALLESERAYRSTFDEAPVGIAHMALDGGWLRVNVQLCDLLGYSGRELMATDLDALAHPEEVEQDREARGALMTGAVDRRSGVRRYQRKDGKFIWANLTLSLHRDAAGSPRYFIAIIEDISERRHLEEQLRQSQKMEAIGRLAGGVAHDFNNLLTAILGYSHFVLDWLDPAHPCRSHVDEIRKAGESASSLTRQLLAFSRQQVLQPQILDLNQTVRQMDALLRRLIGEDIALTSQLAAQLDPVSVDPGQIEQIVLNLAVNARDAMSSGGQLTIETANVSLDETYVAGHPGASVGPHVMLAVSDTGTGMSAETVSRVFEPFFTTKARGEGTGLGLATTYGIVKQSGGSIWVYSELEQGTTFKVYLPRATYRDRPQVVAPPPAEAVGGAETILVAEDQGEVRKLTRQILSLHGYTVLEATSGSEALRIVRDHPDPIHLLFTDVIMPGMSGREVVSALEITHPGIRVLFASGYTDDAIVRHGKLDPGVAFLQKPFTPKALLAKVREVLDAPAPTI